VRPLPPEPVVRCKGCETGLLFVYRGIVPHPVFPAIRVVRDAYVGLEIFVLVSCDRGAPATSWPMDSGFQIGLAGDQPRVEEKVGPRVVVMRTFHHHLYLISRLIRQASHPAEMLIIVA
jgi:hypothetical protein